MTVFSILALRTTFKPIKVRDSILIDNNL